MSTQELRDKLIAFIAQADEQKLAALHVLLNVDEATELTEEQRYLLNEERAQYLTGKEKSYSPEESIEIIRGRK
jgi:hypothetical protein